ncbi:MAG: nuclear transport factor 2 family protein [Bacteroidia bacterium]|nr:nuclear transport factor 2 family protein [Bacteroidia bacterium]
MNNSISTFGWFILLIGLSGNIAAQSNSEEDKILNVIQGVFDGMQVGDSAMVRSHFYHELEMYTSYTNKEGKRILSKDEPQKFFDAIGTPHDRIWNEEWWSPEVRIDGNLAQVWTPYAFYIDDTFSHCGVDAFHLIRLNDDSWKIFHLTDTRQRADCDIPEAIRIKHEK